MGRALDILEASLRFTRALGLVVVAAIFIYMVVTL